MTKEFGSIIFCIHPKSILHILQTYSCHTDIFWKIGWAEDGFHWPKSNFDFLNPYLPNPSPKKICEGYSLPKIQIMHLYAWSHDVWKTTKVGTLSLPTYWLQKEYGQLSQGKCMQSRPPIISGMPCLLWCICDTFAESLHVIGLMYFSIISLSWKPLLIALIQLALQHSIISENSQKNTKWNAVWCNFKPGKQFYLSLDFAVFCAIISMWPIFILLSKRLENMLKHWWSKSKVVLKFLVVKTSISIKLTQHHRFQGKLSTIVDDFTFAFPPVFVKVVIAIVNIVYSKKSGFGEKINSLQLN